MLSTLLRNVAHFVAWRRWGIVFQNPVLENTYVFFFAFLLSGTSFTSVLPKLGLFMLLIAFMSSYGYLLNDAVDCERDLGHGIRNVFDGYNSTQATVVVLSALAPSIPLVLYFSSNTAYFLSTWAAWLLCASAYSMPGVYLKSRGLTGLVAVALALRTLPIMLVLEVFSPGPDAIWIMFLVYLTLRGLGGDLSHQITDFDKDRADRLSTGAIRLGRARALSLLDTILVTERVALLILCGWMFVLLVQTARLPPIVELASASLLIIAVALVAFAHLQFMRGARGCDPHRPIYPEKDVFYLLHKTFPKIVLSLYLLFLLCLKDWAYALLLLPLGWYFRLYSWKRIVRALRLHPRPERLP